MGQHGRVRAGLRLLAGTAALCALAAAPGPTALAAPADTADPPAYETAEDAQKVRGTASSADARELKPGVYTDTIGPGETRYYSVVLDAGSSAFLSAVAAPGPDEKVAYGDGIEISLQGTDGTDCGLGGDATFGSAEFPRPVADYASRKIQKNAPCQERGPYNVIVERESVATSSPGRWPVELRYMLEPGVKGGSTTPPAKGSWSTASPVPPSGQRQARSGGTGFNDARAIEQGVWQDELRPGETAFYRVPLDWGQQLTANAELANGKMTKPNGYVGSALNLDLYNTARGAVSSGSTAYDGDQSAVGLGPTAPADYDNRYDSATEVTAMRFAGWYYLAVGLSPKVADFVSGTVPLTLRITVQGEPREGPAYVGDAAAAGFGITDEVKEQADKGQTADEAGDSGSLRIVAFAGIGTGVVLLLGLGVWTVVARRRGVPATAPAGGVPPQGQPGYPGQPLPGQPGPPGHPGQGYGPGPYHGPGAGPGQAQQGQARQSQGYGPPSGW